MMIYLAADYARKHEMQGCRDVLESMGHKVTARWIDNDDSIEDAGGTGVGIDDANRMYYSQFADKDFEDIDASEVFILFTTGALSRGGRHTEFGRAQAKGKRLIIIGPREHVFHCTQEVSHYPAWRSFVVDCATSFWSGKKDG